MLTKEDIFQQADEEMIAANFVKNEQVKREDCPLYVAYKIKKDTSPHNLKAFYVYPAVDAAKKCKEPHDSQFNTEIYGEDEESYDFVIYIL